MMPVWMLADEEPAAAGSRPVEGSTIVINRSRYGGLDLNAGR